MLAYESFYANLTSALNYSSNQFTGLVQKLAAIAINLIITGVMQQSLAAMLASPRMRKVECSSPCRDRPKSLKQVVTVPLLNAR